MAKNDLIAIGTEKFAIEREERAGYRNRITIYGSTGNEYIVSQRVSDGVWCCACLGWRRFRHCKHLDSMMPALAQLDSPKSRKKLA